MKERFRFSSRLSGRWVKPGGSAGTLLPPLRLTPCRMRLRPVSSMNQRPSAFDGHIAVLFVDELALIIAEKLLTLCPLFK